MIQKESILIKSRAEWREWLNKNHRRQEGLWVITYKKGHKLHVAAADIVEEALCFGWIDSLPRSLDNIKSQLWLAPRKAGSAWSKLNKERAERMIKAKLMTKSGLLKIKEAQKSGKWDFLNDVQNGTVPEDLAKALDKNKPALKNFNAFPPSSKRIILEWIKMAKKPETRRKRIEETVKMAAQNLRANHYRQKADVAG